MEQHTFSLTKTSKTALIAGGAVLAVGGVAAAGHVAQTVQKGLADSSNMRVVAQDACTLQTTGGDVHFTGCSSVL